MHQRETTAANSSGSTVADTPSTGSKSEYRENIDPTKIPTVSPLVSGTMSLIGWVFAYLLGIFAAAFVKISVLGTVICLALALLVVYKLSKGKKPVRLATIIWAAVVVLSSITMLAAPSSSTPQSQAAAQDAPAAAVEKAPAPSKQ